MVRRKTSGITKAAAVAIVVIIIVAAVAGAAYFFILGGPGGGGTIKVGVLENLTGGMASIDAPALNGIKLKAKEINEAGGLLGRQVEIIAIDTKTDQAEAAAAAKRLVEQGVVAIIGYGDTTFVLAAAPIAQEAGIPFITQGATHPRLPEFVGDMMFLTPFGDNIQAAVMAEYAVKELGYKTVAIWVDYAMDFSVAVCSYFMEAWKHYTGDPNSVVLVDRFKTDDTDFSAQIARLKALDPPPDAIFLGATPGNVGLMVKQIREAGITIPILGQDGFDTPQLVEVAGEAAEGVLFVTHVSLESDDPMVRKFVEAYTEEYGHPPENAFAALGYDAMTLLADAIQRAGSTDPQAIKKALEETRNLRVVTGTITYEAGSHVPSKSVAIIKVENGKFKTVKTMVPSFIPDPKKDRVILEV